jgi:hypothetical protein
VTGSFFKRGGKTRPITSRSGISRDQIKDKKNKNGSFNLGLRPTQNRGVSFRNDDVRMLTNVLKKGKMSPDLRKAVEAIITAFKNGNLDLATELTAVKSLISGISSKDPSYPFNEDSNYNQKVLGEDIYSILGKMHFDLSLRSGKMPSGFTVLESRGIGNTPEVIERERSNIEHPTITKINAELERLRRESYDNYRKERF